MDAAGTETFTADTFYNCCDILAAKDSVLHHIIHAHGYPPFWSRTPGFASLIHIILEQQVSLASALSAYNKLSEKLPKLTPDDFLLLSNEALRDCYFSRQKTVYTRHLASCITSGELNLFSLTHKDNDTISSTLKKVKGIGDWTVNIYLMMVLHRIDVFPLNDIALISSIKHEYQLLHVLTKEDIQQVSKQWKPFRTIAAYLLWHAYLSRRKRQ
jgi:DNA-3-methyladenine glycosylase II